MQRQAPVVLVSLSAMLILGCESKTPVEMTDELNVPSLAKGGPGGGTAFATRAVLPPLKGGAHGEAYAIDRAGTLIGGYSYDRNAPQKAVTWSLQNGTWQVTAYPSDPSATGAVIKGINDQRDKVGAFFFFGGASQAVLWNAAGSFTVLGCNEPGEAYGISSGAQVVVGIYRVGSLVSAAVWRPGQCRESLPPIIAGGFAFALAVNGDGTIAGGYSGDAGGVGFPVRWRRINGAWEVEQLDTRQGAVFGANGAGDLVGAVGSACSGDPTVRCHLDVGFIWYVNGGSRVLPTLSGGTIAPRAINSSREVVGLSTLAGNENGVPFIWSETLGILQLPLPYGGWAFAISDVRADGTRLVAGAGGRPFNAQVWVVRNP
jgi:hypothetical protein